MSEIRRKGPKKEGCRPTWAVSDDFFQMTPLMIWTIAAVKLFTWTGRLTEDLPETLYAIR